MFLIFQEFTLGIPTNLRLRLPLFTHCWIKLKKINLEWFLSVLRLGLSVVQAGLLLDDTRGPLTLAFQEAGTTGKYPHVQPCDYSGGAGDETKGSSWQVCYHFTIFLPHM